MWDSTFEQGSCNVFYCYISFFIDVTEYWTNTAYGMLEDRGDRVNQAGEAGSGHLYGSGNMRQLFISQWLRKQTEKGLEPRQGCKPPPLPKVTHFS